MDLSARMDLSATEIQLIRKVWQNARANKKPGLELFEQMCHMEPEIAGFWVEFQQKAEQEQHEQNEAPLNSGHAATYDRVLDQIINVLDQKEDATKLINGNKI